MADDTRMLIEQLFQRGKTLRINGEYQEAITVLTHIIQTDASHASAHMELGLAHCYAGDFDSSLRELELATCLDQTNPEICLHLAKTYTMLGMYDQGATTFRRVLEISVSGDGHYEEAKKQLSYFAQMH